MPIELTARQRRLLDAVLVLAVLALGFVVLGFLAQAFTIFGDLVLLILLAWLLSFALAPLIDLIGRVFPRVPRAVAVVVVYVAIVGGLLVLLVQLSATLVTSIGQLVADAPALEASLRDVLAEVERRLATFGFDVALVDQAPEIIENLRRWATELVGPLQSLAFATFGVMGNILILVILSVYIAVDRPAITLFLFRLVPPGWGAEAQLLNVSVSRSFGGFLRGQLAMGVLFGIFTAVVNLAFNLPYVAVSSVVAGVLQAIPFFGPFVSWVPPVAVAILLQPEATLPVLVLMGIAWFVVMNIVSPRMLSGAVGIHPIVVLASVLVGLRIAGIPGAIFGIPIAAVASAFFFHWFGRVRDHGSVADRAARRLATREGRQVRRPREPVAGVDADVDGVADVATDEDTDRETDARR